MIVFNELDKSFYLETNKTSYVFFINDYGHLQHVYYGEKIKPIETIKDFLPTYQFELGTSVSYSEDAKGYMLQYTNLEVSTFGKGDFRNPMLHVTLPDGTRTLDFKYQSHKLISDLVFENMPQARKKETLEVCLKDEDYNIELYLYYSVFEESDVLIRNMKIVNKNKSQITLKKVLSMQVDMLYKDQVLLKLDGAWIRERHIETHQISKGIFLLDSKQGNSSNTHNPMMIVKDKTTTNDHGDCLGMTLIYSGNFEANIERNSHDFLRLNMGLNSFDFEYKLENNQTFISPEVVLTFSGQGLNTLSNQFHKCINEHIVKEDFVGKERPIIVNNWEATYFDFNQKKLLAITKKAKKLGIELFCLDDGWFARRNDDYSSLGDWYYNKKKLPSGVQGICKKINKLGLDFGIWVEPEMVNTDSDLYREHPEWAVQLPYKKPALGRNQLVLDFSQIAVQDYIIDTLTNLLNSAPIKYVKWDMNRNMTDLYSSGLEVDEQAAFSYLFIMGLYRVLDVITNRFKDVLFESCASGGNRFDLGMAYYMPQTWTSDNTDSFERTLIQEGTSMVYPLSMMSNHVSGDRSHQVLRHTPLESRFNVAMFGVLGYELDLSKLHFFDSEIIKRQVAFYKKHRSLLQFGTFKRISSVKDSNYCIWQVTSKDQTEALVLYFQDKALPNPGFQTIQINGLKEGRYKVQSRQQFMNVRVTGSLVNHVLPVKLKVNGFLLNAIANRYLFESEQLNKTMTNDQLERAELLLFHPFSGTGQNEQTMVMPDYGSRIFHIKKENEDENKS
jgi:alpha-galactosidase